MDGANDWMPSQLERQLSPTQAVCFCLSPLISISYTQPKGKKTGSVCIHILQYILYASAVHVADAALIFVRVHNFYIMVDKLEFNKGQIQVDIMPLL